MGQRGRKPIYTPEEAKQRATVRSMAYNQANTTTVNIRMSHKDKAAFTAFAKELDMPVGTMIRLAVKHLMEDNGWRENEQGDGEGIEELDNGF